MAQKIITIIIIKKTQKFGCTKFVAANEINTRKKVLVFVQLIRITASHYKVISRVAGIQDIARKQKRKFLSV